MRANRFVPSYLSNDHLRWARRFAAPVYMLALFASCTPRRGPEAEPAAPGTQAVVAPHGIEEAGLRGLPRDLLEPPPAGPPPLTPFPTARHFNLQNGMALRVISRGAPIAEVRLVLLGGSSTDGAKPGTSLLTGQLLAHGGGGTLPAAAIERKLASWGTSFDVRATPASLQLSLSVAPAHVDEAIELLGELVESAHMAGSDHVRWLTAAELARRERVDGTHSLRHVALEALYTSPTGVHPYATTPSSEDVEKVTLADCRVWASKFVRPDRAHLVVVGAVDPNTVESVTKKAFATWDPPGAAPPSSTPPAPHGPENLVIELVDADDSTWSWIRLAALGPGPSSEARPGARVALATLAGSPGTRLPPRITALGGTESESRLVEFGKGPDLIEIDAEGPTEATVRIIRTLVEEAARLGAEGPDEASIEAAALRLTSARLLDLERPSDLAQLSANLIERALPETFYDDERARFRSLTAREVHRDAVLFLRRERFVVVVVGDADRLDKPLSSLAPVRVLDPQRGYQEKRSLPHDPTQSPEVAPPESEGEDGPSF